MHATGLLFLALTSLGLGGEPPKYDITALYQKVSLLVRSYYPDAVCQMLDGRIHFEYKTRIFLVHEPLKTGEWQDPNEELGPQKGGIVGDIELREGPSISQAVVPQSFDKRYFVVLLLSPSSEQLNAHLHVLIKYPPDLTGNFLQDIKDLLYQFETTTLTSHPKYAKHESGNNNRIDRHRKNHRNPTESPTYSIRFHGMNSSSCQTRYTIS